MAVTYNSPGYYSTSGSGYTTPSYPGFDYSVQDQYWPKLNTTFTASFIDTVTPERNDTVTLTIKSVQLKAGWVGQLWNGTIIVWESKPKKTQAKGTLAASKAKNKAIARLFEDN